MLDKIIFVFCFLIGVLGTVFCYITEEYPALLISGFWLGYSMGILKGIINAE